MALIDFNVKCTLMNRETFPVPNGGGEINAWFDGDQFDAAIAVHLQNNIIVADKSEGSQTYSIYVDKNCTLRNGDYFRNESNGRLMKVNSIDKEPPSMSTLSVRLFYGVYIGSAIDELPN